MSTPPFWPATLVDYAQILSAIATAAAVIVSLYIATRQQSERLKLDLGDLLVFESNTSMRGKNMQVTGLAYHLDIVNVGPIPVTLQFVSLASGGWFGRQGEMAAILFLRVVSDTEPEEERIQFGQDLSFRISMDKATAIGITSVWAAKQMFFEVETTTGRRFRRRLTWKMAKHLANYRRFAQD
ncbi:hypothetical protein [Herbaspirillum sp. NPDC101396]|uniref:hypothetical protein n=1 Tax=Herbaspirillum sp. NPDC101396 TaxID=3364005 RepID=UPI00383B19DE